MDCGSVWAMQAVSSCVASSQHPLTVHSECCNSPCTCMVSAQIWPLTAAQMCQIEMEKAEQKELHFSPLFPPEYRKKMSLLAALSLGAAGPDVMNYFWYLTVIVAFCANLACSSSNNEVLPKSLVQLSIGDSHTLKQS